MSLELVVGEDTGRAYRAESRVEGESLEAQNVYEFSRWGESIEVESPPSSE